MGKFNTYRYLVLRDMEDMNKKFRKIRKPAGKLQRIFMLTILLTLFIVIGIYTSTLNPVVEHIAAKLGISEDLYAVVINSDAVKSQLFVYKFHKSLIGGQLILDSENVSLNKPGLSSFIYNPSKGTLVLRDLLKQVCSIVPFDQNLLTPVLYRSTYTSTLPLVQYYQLQRMVNEYFEYVNGIQTLPFKIEPEYFRISSRQEEQVNLWIAVNILKGRYDAPTEAVFDLDSDSAYLTFQPQDASHPLMTLFEPNRNASIFSHTYFNLGLMAARHGIFMAENPENVTYLTSECVNTIIKDQPWRFGDVNYFISGPQKDIKYKEVKETQNSLSSRIPIVRIDRCRELVVTYIRRNLASTTLPQFHEHQSLDFFGQFFEKAAEVGLIDPITGGTLIIKDFLTALESECITPNVDQPWVCLDLTYISTLLLDVFHIDPDRKLEFVTRINGHQAAWALGLAYKTLASQLFNR